MLGFRGKSGPDGDDSQRNPRSCIVWIMGRVLDLLADRDARRVLSIAWTIHDLYVSFYTSSPLIRRSGSHDAHFDGIRRIRCSVRISNIVQLDHHRPIAHYQVFPFTMGRLCRDLECQLHGKRLVHVLTRQLVPRDIISLHYLHRRHCNIRLQRTGRLRAGYWFRWRLYSYAWWRGCQ